MNLLASILVAVLFGSGIYLILKKNFFEVLLGTILLSNGVNVFIIAMSGWRRAQLPPILPGESDYSELAQIADPLPQALILTAIVISFGVTAFLVILLARGFDEHDCMDFPEQGATEAED